MAVADVKELGFASAAKQRVRRDVNRRIRIFIVQAVILLALLLAWQFLVPPSAVPYFSHPDLVAKKLIELFRGHDVYRNIWVTFTEIVLGYLLGAFFGLVLGFVLGRSKFLSAVFQPFIMCLYSVPKIALAPLFIVWLGLGMGSKVAVVFISSFFLIFFNTYSGLQNVNEELVRLARLMGASWPQTVARVILPAAADKIFIGLKTAVPYAVIGAVIGEYIGSSEGLGYFILYSSQTYDTPSLFAGIIILVALVLITNGALSWLEKRVIRWRVVQNQTVQM
jgi:NitT/TauT family transport system permease protein